MEFTATTTSLLPEQIAAYRAAIYTFEHSGKSTTLHVDQWCADLSSIYDGNDGCSLTFITACNPWGNVVSDEINATEMNRLHRELQSLRLPIFRGVGKDPAGPWQEASFALLGMSSIDACQLGIRWQQNAIVWVGADAIPRLKLLR